MIQVFFAAFLWGFSGAFAKLLMRGNLEPNLLIPLRFLGSFLVLLPVLIRLPPRRTELPRLLMLGLMLTLAQSSFYLTVHISNVATALFLQCLAPVLLTLYALLQGERLSKQNLLGVGLAVVGSYLVVVGPHGLVGGWWGLVFGLASALLFAAFAQLSMGLQANPWTVLGTAVTVGSFLSLPLTPWKRVLSLGMADWVAVACIVLLGTVVPFGLFLWGAQRISARLATVVTMVEPFSGAVFAIFFVAEPLRTEVFLGGVLLLLGVWLNTKTGKKCGS